MIFGEAVVAVDTVESAGWIAPALRGSEWTVGALVPNDYPAFLRIRALEPSIEDWWSAYRSLFDTVAEVGARHTSTADRVMFAVWGGRGFDSVSRQVAWIGPVDETVRIELAHERARLGDANRRRTARIRASLRKVPRFALPNRSYYLLSGPVTAATQLRNPSISNYWLHLDLFWPADRRWFVATDIDFWSLYVGGDQNFIDEIVHTVPTPTEVVTLEQQLETEDRPATSSMSIGWRVSFINCPRGSVSSAEGRTLPRPKSRSPHRMTRRTITRPLAIRSLRGLPWQ